MEAKMRYLALLVLLVASVAGADGIDNFTYTGLWWNPNITFSLPATLQAPTSGDTWSFETNINYLGGVLSGALGFYAPPDASLAVVELGYPVSYPPGFVSGPSTDPYTVWPYDISMGRCCGREMEATYSL
jgi:hypothetical protein